MNNSSMKFEVKSHVLDCDSCITVVSIKSSEVLRKSRCSFEILNYEALNIRRLNPTLIRQLFNRGCLFTFLINFFEFHFFVKLFLYDETVVVIVFQ